MPIPAGDGTTLPTWAPTLDEVAAYTASRTIVPGSGGTNIELAQFSADTHPTATQAAFFVRDACAWITTRCGDLDESLFDAGTALATRRAAAWAEGRILERQAQNREQAIEWYRELIKETGAALEQLAARNEALTGLDADDPGGVYGVQPVWRFDDCRPRWGEPTYLYGY